MDVLVLSIIGFTLLLWSIVVFIKRNNLYKNGDRIDGEIVDIRKSEEAILDTFNTSATITVYKPIIEFYDNGEKVTFMIDESQNEEEFKIGDKVRLVYDKKGDGKIFIDKRIEFYKFSITIAILAILFFSFAYTIYLCKY